MFSPQQVYLVEELPNPSTQFFVAPALAFNNCPVIHCDFSTLPSSNDLTDAIVIFVRYVPSNWMKLVDTNRNRLNKLIFFMDDDVLDFNASSEMPLRYRYKLARLSTRRAGWLKRMRSELWVSTPYLQQKYLSWQPKLVLPYPVINTHHYFNVFYHGSASHKAEIEWLYPVIKAALSCNDHVCFEIIGGTEVNRLYKGLDRTTIIHPMKWNPYQTLVSKPGRHVGLAPLLDLSFNRARSYTKFFDIHQCGAVGIFSPNSACGEIVDHNIDGILVELDQEKWLESILFLADNEAFRLTLFNNAENKLDSLRIAARKSYEGLFNT